MTVSEIIADALTDLGVLAAGEVVEAADEQTCLRAFKNMIKSMPGFGTGRDLTDVVVTTSPYTPNMNERILWAGDGFLSLNLPALVDGYQPHNGDRVAVTSGGNTFFYVYISSRAVWLDVENITASTDSPLGPEHDEALTAMLAARVARRFGVPVTNEIMRDAASASRVIVRSKDRRQAWDDQDVLN
ncbi:MAG: hypothetical protein ING71_16720 [Rhodocyclaceae bacterium]|nr:hypothetical protein [Rhodocyclaceae bacterium]